MSTSREVLDLHSLAVLINYERTSGPASDPRFRHAKLRDISSPSGKFRILPDDDNIWASIPEAQPKYGFLLDTLEPSDEHDLPGNMVDSQSEPALSILTEQQLEIIFYQIRGHDACFHGISILQILAGMYSPDQSITVRLCDGTEFITPFSRRVIMEFDFTSPKQTTLSLVVPPRSKYKEPAHFRYTGEKFSMRHAVWGFARPGDENISVILDLASMQYGAPGCGLSGHFFILQTQDEWYDFVEKIVKGCDMVGTSQRITDSGDIAKDAWFNQVAQRVKERWDARETNHWCGLCGRPGASKCCGGCKKEYYCSEAHRKAAWKGWHKKWCKAAPQK
ncbi:hypothetical protein C0991_002226 [Blastosporella zonata]|nr:hypothetical protein C0991_002226 [Blastosporella zonata]